MLSKTLLIRADASAEIGAGHVMRCIALAQAWQNTGGQVIFALAAGGEELADRVRSEGAEVAKLQAKPGSRDDAAATSELRAKCRAQWLVLDGYHFSSDYLQRVEGNSGRSLWMSDGEERLRFKCDVIVNPDPDASAERSTQHDGQTQFLFGPRYALLRRQFLEFPLKRSEEVETARRVLVTLGGGDIHNVTLQAIEAVQKITDAELDLTVVVGPNNPHRESLEVAARKSEHRLKLLSNVDDMPGLMAQSDLAITAGGGTCYELAFMRVPMFLITMAANHERAVRAYQSAKAAVAAGWFDSLDGRVLAESLRDVIGNRTLRREIADNAKQMVDGKGAERVVHAMQAFGPKKG